MENTIVAFVIVNQDVDNVNKDVLYTVECKEHGYHVCGYVDRVFIGGKPVLKGLDMAIKRMQRWANDEVCMLTNPEYKF